MIDVSGVMLAGAVTPSARIIQGLARETYGGGACTVIGTNDRLTAPGAALANGASAHALDFDDNSYAGVVHGSAVVFPAVLAVAQRIEASGAELLQGFVAGLEVEFALGLALTEAFYDRGWWTTSALGAMGAAAGVARVTDLDAEATARAIRPGFFEAIVAPGYTPEALEILRTPNPITAAARRKPASWRRPSRRAGQRRRWTCSRTVTDSYACSTTPSSTKLPLTASASVSACSIPASTSNAIPPATPVTRPPMQPSTSWPGST